ncbi:uncharacterized protein G2W53_035849 [Senna tora]|uniref:Uncharacterized protein n=1 Tax=Senna tora TaxID=362788 RepID=A0A834W803_9FABA|nr:uncharacterized protein G2W53_035849 [Senna tora]
MQIMVKGEAMVYTCITHVMSHNNVNDEVI